MHEYYSRSDTVYGRTLKAIIQVVLAFVALMEPEIVDAKQSAGDVQLSLIIVEPRQCTTMRKLSLELVVTNGGSTQISVPKYAFYSFWFTRERTSGHRLTIAQREFGNNIIEEPQVPDAPLSIGPHTSMVVPIQVRMENSFLRHAGRFSLVAYMRPPAGAIYSVESNEVLFDVIDCEPPTKLKEAPRKGVGPRH